MWRFCAFVIGIAVCATGVILVASSCVCGIDDTLLARANIALIGLAITVWTFPEHAATQAPSPKNRRVACEDLFADELS